MHICKKCKHWVSAKTKNHVCGVKTKVNDYRSPVVTPPTPPAYVPSYTPPTPKKEDNSIEDVIIGAAIGYGLSSLFSDDSSSSSDNSSNNDNDSSSFGGFGGGDFGGGGSSSDW